MEERSLGHFSRIGTVEDGIANENLGCNLSTEHVLKDTQDFFTYKPVPFSAQAYVMTSEFWCAAINVEDVEDEFP